MLFRERLDALRQYDCHQWRTGIFVMRENTAFAFAGQGRPQENLVCHFRDILLPRRMAPPLNCSLIWFGHGAHPALLLAVSLAKEHPLPYPAGAAPSIAKTHYADAK